MNGMQVAGEILQSFSLCLGLNLAEVTVDFCDGVVHLRGTVPTEYMKEAAEELAAWTPSVASVINELRVLEPLDAGWYLSSRLAKSSSNECLSTKT
jgi:osmotically-inducible protein OsmY